MCFFSSSLVGTGCLCVRKEVLVGIKAYKGINLPAVGHSVLFLVFCSLRLQFPGSRWGSVSNSFLTSVGSHSHACCCLLIPDTVLCQGKEWVALLVELSHPSLEWGELVSSQASKWFLYGIQPYRKCKTFYFMNSTLLCWWSAVRGLEWLQS